jgi:hypothetical protein
LRKALKLLFNTILFRTMVRYQVPKLLYTPKRDTEIQKVLSCWSRMSRNRCFGLKKYSITKKEEAKRKMKKIKKKTLSYKRKKQLDAVNGKH